MILSLVCVNGVVPAALTFAAMMREIAVQEPVQGPDTRTRTVALHDLVGYCDELPSGYSLRTEVAALEEIADRLGRCHLLGYSAGASVALAFAVTNADRVASLTLIEPPWLGLPDRSLFQARMNQIMLHTRPEDRWVRFHRLLVRPGATVPPVPPDPPSWAPQRVARGERVWRALAAETLDIELLRAFDRPVYLPVSSDSHPWFAAAAGRLAAAFPRARVDEYPGNHIRPPHVGETTRFVAALRELWTSTGDRLASGRPDQVPEHPPTPMRSPCRRIGTGEAGPPP